MFKVFLRFITTGLILTLPLLTVAGRINVCSSCPVSSITNAIAIALPHDTISINGGIYNEGNIIVDKPLVFIGIDFPQIDGNGEFEIFTITADSVVVTGLQFQNIEIYFIFQNYMNNFLYQQV